jgi:2-oxoisovalerate dehydrogenase E1 component alpha subunit
VAKTDTRATARVDARVDAETLRVMYRHMLRARMLDERIWVLNRQGLAPFWVSGIGHEAPQVALAMHLRPGHDWVAPYYRDLALCLVLGMTPRDHLLSALARAADPSSGGRQMPAHFGCRRLNIISTGSVVATQVLHAAGIALASVMRGEDAVTVTILGEGSTSEGDFSEALSFAGIHRLPVVFMVENNGIAISLPASKQMPASIAERGPAFGMPGVVIDGDDPIRCHRLCGEAVARARRGEGPTLIDARVRRLSSHSSDDDQRRYRDAEDIAEDSRHDCLQLFAAQLEELGVLPRRAAEVMRRQILEEIDAATAEAEAAPMPEVGTELLHVLAGPEDGVAPPEAR